MSAPETYRNIYKQMYRNRLHTFIILLTFSWAGLVHSQAVTMNPNYEQAQRFMQAVAKILLREQLTHTLLDSCSASYAHLKSSAEQSRKKWHDMNRETLTRTKRVQKSVIQNIHETQSPQNAEKFSRDIDDLILNSVAGFKQELENKSRKDRHYVCNRLILSISAGDWDLSRQAPKAVKQITDFK